MRKKTNLLLTAFCFAILLTACDSTSKEVKDKVTDIPVTTKSKDALASFQAGLQLFDDGDFQQAQSSFSKIY